MESMEPKKNALVRIRTILEEQTDDTHHLTQQQIVEILDREYGLSLERKAVGRNLALLREMGMEIENARDGSFLSSRTFLDAELRMLIDGVFCSRNITAKHSKDLIERLCGMSSKFFKPHVKHIYSVNDWSKTENPSLFYNIEMVDTAIERCRQISFDFNRYGIDKKLHKTAEHQMSPYQMLIHNQKYYLMGYHEKHKSIAYYRLDHITNMRLTDDVLTPIRTLEGYENGIDYKRLSASLPYLFNDPPELIEMIVDARILDEIVEWFGTDVRMQDLGDGRLRVSLQSSPMAMEHWAMQYSNFVEITKPEKLRSQLCENAKRMAEKYR